MAGSSYKHFYVQFNVRFLRDGDSGVGQLKAVSIRPYHQGPGRTKAGLKKKSESCTTREDA